MKNSSRNKLSTVQIETTDRCNHRCIMCARTENPPKKTSQMTLPRFARVLQQLRGTTANVYVGHNLGEPLLTADYIGMLELFDRKMQNKLFIFNTNASKLSRAFTKRFLALKNNRYQLNISLDAATGNSYKKLHGYPLAAVRKNILEFLKTFVQADNKQLKVILNFIVTPVNVSEQKKFMTQWKPFLKQNRRIKLKFNPLAWNNLLRDKYNYDIWTSAHPDAAIFKLTKPRQKSCYKPWQMLSIKADGSVGICCYDTTSALHLGNIFRSSLKQLLRSKKMRQLKQDFRKKDFSSYPLCYFCHG